MDTREIFERLDRVFQDVFDDDTLHVTPKTTADDIEDWDSLEHITLISAVEREFRIKFKMGEISSMKNVGEMASIIAGLILPQKKMPQTTGFSRACGIFIFTVIYNGS